MSAIFYKNLPYGAGGSNVEANPSGSATGDLTKVGIDGTVYDVTDADAVHSADKGVANGVASLDATGRVPSTQLPSYVDDVLEYASLSAFPATGESGKIYIALDTNKTYRWSGSAYVEISESLALGETTGTAYEGSKGKANADNIASLQTAINKAYNTDDSAETDLQDTDYIPFYDTSATAKKKSLWSNIKAKLKAYFDTLYDKTPTLATVATSGSYNDLTNKPKEVDTPSTTPFLYRPTPFNADGVFVDDIVGASVGWNQIYNASASTNKSVKNVTINNINGTVSISGTSNDSGNGPYFNWTGWSAYPLNHVVFFLADFTLPTGCRIINQYCSGTSRISNILNCVWKASSDGQFLPQLVIGSSGQQFNISNKHLMLFDLTQMFGVTIADYILSLEQATAGSGIAWLKSYGFFTKSYYSYNAGELISVKTSGKKYVEFNVWDEEWESGTYSSTGEPQANSNYIRSKNANPISFIPNETYYLKSNSGIFINFFDKNGIFTRQVTWQKDTTLTTNSNEYFAKFVVAMQMQTYYHDICINISKTEGTPKNGDYVPYKEHTYPTSDIDLRGIPKLVDNELAYDGDIYESNGNVTRKYGRYDLGADFTWSYDSGNHLFYTNVVNDFAPSTGYNTNIVCAKYVVDERPYSSLSTPHIMGVNSNKRLCVIDTNYSDAATFKTANTGVYIDIELATPTRETTDPYTSPQICDKNGTEEFIDNRTVPIPVGHNSRYADLPESMDGDFLSYMTKNLPHDEWLTVKDSSNVISVFHNLTITGAVSWTRTLISKLSDYRFMYIEVTNTDYNYLALNEIVLVDTLLSGIYYNKQFSIYGDDGTITVYLYGSGQIVIGASVPSSVNSVKVSIKLIA